MKLSVYLHEKRMLKGITWMDYERILCSWYSCCPNLSSYSSWYHLLLLLFLANFTTYNQQKQPKVGGKKQAEDWHSNNIFGTAYTLQGLLPLHTVCKHFVLVESVSLLLGDVRASSKSRLYASKPPTDDTFTHHHHFPHSCYNNKHGCSHCGGKEIESTYGEQNGWSPFRTAHQISNNQ